MHKIHIWIGPTINKNKIHIGHYSSIIRLYFNMTSNIKTYISWHPHYYYDDDKFADIKEVNIKLDIFKKTLVDNDIKIEKYISIIDDKWLTEIIQKTEHLNEELEIFKYVDFDTGIKFNNKYICINDFPIQIIHLLYYSQYDIKAKYLILSSGSDLDIKMLNRCIEVYQKIYNKKLNIEIIQSGLLLHNTLKISKSKIETQIFNNSTIKLINKHFIKFLLKFKLKEDIDFNLKTYTTKGIN